jgi:hypothetical protein
VTDRQGYEGHSGALRQGRDIRWEPPLSSSPGLPHSHWPWPQVHHGCPLSSYHPLHDDDLGPQRLADSENVHQPETENDEVQREDNAPGVQCRRDEPGSRAGQRHSLRFCSPGGLTASRAQPQPRRGHWRHVALQTLARLS